MRADGLCRSGGGGANLWLLRDRPSDGAAVAAVRIYEGLGGMGDWPCVVFNAIEGGNGWLCGAMNACRSARVSLSDWLALWARIRGFETPRLLRDRPTDGAARAEKLNEGVGGACAWYGWSAFLRG